MTRQVEDMERKKGRWLLLGLFALFLLPLLAVLFMVRYEWRPGGFSHGELVAPPRLLQPVGLKDVQGVDFPVERWQSRWSLVMVARDGCSEECRTQVNRLRQVHVSLNKNMDRLQRILLATGQDAGDSLAALRQHYPDLAVLRGAETTQFARQFDRPGSAAGESGRVYLVDPLGNLMMTYPPGHDASGIRKDLERLLKYSWVG